MFEIVALIYVWSIAIVIDELADCWFDLPDTLIRILASPFYMPVYIVRLHRGEV